MIQRINGIDGMEELEKILNRTQMDSPEVLQRVDQILDDVRLRGDSALLEYTKMYDGHELENLRVTREEIEEARENIDPGLRKAMENAIENITRFTKIRLTRASLSRRMISFLDNWSTRSKGLEYMSLVELHPTRQL